MNMRLLAGLLFAVSVVGFSLGASLPLVSLRLHEAGASTLEIGIISAIPAAGMMLSAFLVDICCRHLTRRTIYLLCFSLCTVSIALLESAFGSLWLLALLRVSDGTFLRTQGVFNGALRKSTGLAVTVCAAALHASSRAW